MLLICFGQPGTAKQKTQGIKNFYTSISVCMSVYLHLQDVHIGYNTSQSFPFINLLFPFNDFFLKINSQKRFVSFCVQSE